MAYTNETRIDKLLGGVLVDDLLDLDQDGSPDTGVLDQHIADVGAVIDAYVSRRYETPMPDIGDTPATPAYVQLIATWLLASFLLLPRTQAAKQRELYGNMAYDALKGIRDGKTSLPDATALDPDDQGTEGFAYETSDGAKPKFSGLDDDGDDPMENF